MRAIVIGAGPAGATAALVLARAGATVRMFEQKPWPREKACGDAISPEGIRECERLGVRVEGRVRLATALVSTPRGTAFRGGWPAATPWGTTIERRAFDALLVDAAIAAGAEFLPGTPVRTVLRDGGAIAATFGRDGARGEDRFDVAIVADGAAGGSAAALGFPPHRSRLVTMRGYADAVAPLAPEYGLFYERVVSPGYGWVFPMDERRANAGVLVDERVLRRNGGDLRALCREWLATSVFARERLGDDVRLESARGGIIPSGRRRRAAGGAFLVGDAAGVADPFTAEGIYQAILSGRLAAEAIAAEQDVQRAGRRYERALRPLDRNERAARGLRATFNVAIEPYARHARRVPRYADRLNTEAFFMKRSLAGFVWAVTRHW